MEASKQAIGSRKQVREAGKEGKDSGTLTLRLGAEITLHMAH